MPKPSPDAGLKDITGLYLEFSESGSFGGIDDSTYVADHWPAEAGGQITLGYEDKLKHTETGPAIIIARIAQLATATVLEMPGVKNAWQTINPAILAHTISFDTIIYGCLSNVRNDVQAAGLYLVANFLSAATPHLREVTAQPSELSVFSIGNKTDASEGVHARDNLSPNRYTPARIRALSAKCIHHVLQRDMGIDKFDERTMEAYTRLAVFQAMAARGMRPGTNAWKVHAGQFMAACEDIMRRTGVIKTAQRATLQRYLGKEAYAVYDRLKGQNVAPVWPQQIATGFGRFDISKIRRRRRSMDDVLGPAPDMQPTTGIRLPLPEAQSQQRSQERLTDLDALYMKLSRGEISVTDARLAALRIIGDKTAECRQLRDDEMRRRERRAEVRNRVMPNIYRRHPYIDPRNVASVTAGHDIFVKELAWDTRMATHRLYDLARRLHDNRPGGESKDWTSALAAALLGPGEAQREAAASIASVRGSLQRYVITHIPIITRRTIHSIPDLKKFGTSAEEILSSGVATSSLVPDLPLDIYTLAALSVIDRGNPNSLFPTVVENNPSLPQIIRRSKPLPGAEKTHALLNTRVAPIIYEEAAAQVGGGTCIYLTSDDGKVRHSLDGHPIYNYQIADSLVLCRLARSLQRDVISVQPSLSDHICLRLGELIEGCGWEGVQHRLPDDVNATLRPYLERHRANRPNRPTFKVARPRMPQLPQLPRIKITMQPPDRDDRHQ